MGPHHLRHGVAPLPLRTLQRGRQPLDGRRRLGRQDGLGRSGGQRNRRVIRHDQHRRATLAGREPIRPSASSTRSRPAPGRPTWCSTRADLLAFLDARPVFEGHTLVIPRRHATTIADAGAGAARTAPGGRQTGGRRPAAAPSAPTGRSSPSTTSSARASRTCTCTSSRDAAGTDCAASSGPAPATTTRPRPPPWLPGSAPPCPETPR